VAFIIGPIAPIILGATAFVATSMRLVLFHGCSEHWSEHRPRRGLRCR
jgi:hypothetical protein